MQTIRPLATLCLWLLLAIASATWAAAPAEVPAHTSLLVDETGTLDAEERDRLLARLQAIQSSGRAQIAILISGGTGGAPLSDYALRVAESWQLGRADRDDGLLVLVVPSTHSARLEVGYGLEADIPDARVSQWLDELLPAIRGNKLAAGLDRLLDRIDGALPQPAQAQDAKTIFDEHPEWGAPFALVVFSLFSLFPLFIGRSGGIASGLLLAAFLGAAAFMFWGSESAGIAVASVAFVLPNLWALNHQDDEMLPPWLRYAKAFGNVVGVAMFFSIVTLFVGTGLTFAGTSPWPGAWFSGLLSLGLTVMLFPGRIGDVLMVVLRSAMHFTFVLVVVYVSMAAFTPDPSRLAFAVAAAATASIALALHLDEREKRNAGVRRWSLLFYGLGVLIVAPFALLALFLSIGGEDALTQVMQVAAGGGSLAGILALAARLGLIAAVKIGPGGRFGGGGAGRSG